VASSTHNRSPKIGSTSRIWFALHAQFAWSDGDAALSGKGEYRVRPGYDNGWIGRETHHFFRGISAAMTKRSPERDECGKTLSQKNWTASTLESNPSAIKMA